MVRVYCICFKKFFERFLYNNIAEGIWQIYAEPAVPTVIGKAGSAFLYFQLKGFSVASLAKYKRLFVVLFLL